MLLFCQVNIPHEVPHIVMFQLALEFQIQRLTGEGHETDNWHQHVCNLSRKRLSGHTQDHRARRLYGCLMLKDQQKKR